jgi:hypothetical protein
MSKQIQITKNKKSKEISHLIKSISNQNKEKKWLHHSNYNIVQSSTFAFVDLTDMTQDVTENGRIGTSARIKSLTIGVNFIVADASNRLRTFVFVWFPNTISDNPADTELLIDTTTGYSIMAPFVQTKPSRFKVLMDETINVDTYNIQKSMKRKINVDRTVSFNTGNVTTGAGHIYICFLSDSGVVTHPSLSFDCMVTYTDD